MQFMHGVANLFPMFPREVGCSQSVLGTKLLNSDNGLRGFFGFVPSVPKKKGQYPREGTQGDAHRLCLAMPFRNESWTPHRVAPPHVGSFLGVLSAGNSSRPPALFCSVPKGVK